MEPSEEEPSIERQLVRVGSWVMALIGTIGCFNNVMLGIAPVATVVLVLVALTGVGLLVAARRGASTGALARVFVVTVIASMAASWHSAGGVRGSISTIVPILAGVGVLVLPLRSARAYLGLMCATLVGLVGTELASPDSVAPQIPGLAGLIDYTTAALMAVVAVGLSTLAMRRAYVRDRELLIEQKLLVAEAGRNLEAALAAARRSDAAKSLFLANMSHELRTPLAGVLGHAELLMRSELPADAGVHASALVRASRHLQRLVDDLLDLGRIEREEFVARPEDVRLADVLADALADARGPNAPPISLTLDPTLPPRVRVDAGRLRQVVTNLVVNAVRHAGASRILIDARLDGAERLRLCVDDDGRGIAPEELPQLFQPFERDARSAAGGGLGLGLFVVRRVVAALGGDLEVDSAVGRGARFVVRLPFARAAEVVEAPAPPTPVRPGLRVLSADDDFLVRKVLEAMFRALGVEVVSVVDGAAAIARAREEAFDVVFLDTNMPGATGPEVARTIRDEAAARGAPCPTLVALTASAQAVDVEACMAAGMDRFLAKPVMLEDLRRVLDVEPFAAPRVRA